MAGGNQFLTIAETWRGRRGDAERWRNMEWGKGIQSSAGDTEQWRECGEVEWTQSGGGNVSDLNRSTFTLHIYIIYVIIIYVKFGAARPCSEIPRILPIL